MTGLSAEMGDDGQVGRGNRVNGLIAPGRPMSLEAAAGKNPTHHVGKLYNVAAHEIAKRAVAECEEVEEASVQLLSTIGSPVSQPRMALVQVRCVPGPSASLRSRIEALVEEQLDGLDALADRLARGALPVY